MQFVDPTNDLAFKKIFGNDQHKKYFDQFFECDFKI